MKRITIVVFALTIAIGFNVSKACAQWQTDSKYGFKIKLPQGWTQKSHMDGSDKVYDYQSADNNAAVQLRVFDADSRVTTAMLAQVYEQKMLPQGTQKQSLVNHTTTNGIPGMMGLYVLKYNNVDVNMAAFYTVQNSKGYVLTAIIPASMISQKGPEVKSVTQSFVIDGFPKQTVAKQKTTQQPSGLNSLLNKASQTANTTAVTDIGNEPSMVGHYNFVSRSDGKDLLNYWYIILNKDGTYIDRHQLKEGNYTTGDEGTWKASGKQVTLYNKYHPAVNTTYTIENGQMKQVSSSGTVFYFKKQ
ncbi:MAG: hypothetical protein JXR65_03585 [Bacteroidales bacterium]|nr:hypothetical protein [Bacteroidales bacterium]